VKEEADDGIDGGEDEEDIMSSCPPLLSPSRRTCCDAGPKFLPLPLLLLL